MGRVATLGLLVGTAILLVALMIARSLERSRAGKRLTELYQRVQSGETIEIRGESGLLRLFLALVFAAFLLSATAADYPIRHGFIAVAIVALALLELLTIVPLLRHPLLRVSQDGLESPVFGHLAWCDIDGIDLSKLELRYIPLQHRLHLLVLRLPSLTPQMHAATRLKQRILSMFRPNTELRLRLLGTSEAPKVILALCQRTLSQATNNPAIWHKHMPARQLIEQRRTLLDRREREVEKMKASLESPPPAQSPTAKTKSRAQTELEAKLNAQIDTLGFMEALRRQREETRRKVDELWEMKVAPPGPLSRRHWATWVAAAIVGAAIMGVGYLIISSGA